MLHLRIVIGLMQCVDWRARNEIRQQIQPIRRGLRLEGGLELGNESLNKHTQERKEREKEDDIREEKIGEERRREKERDKTSRFVTRSLLV
jgi:hypothetical protein